MYNLLAQTQESGGGLDLGSIADLGELGSLLAVFVFLVWQFGLGRNGSSQKTSLKSINEKTEVLEDLRISTETFGTKIEAIENQVNSTGEQVQDVCETVHEMRETMAANATRLENVEKKVDEIESDLYHGRGRGRRRFRW